MKKYIIIITISALMIISIFHFSSCGNSSGSGSSEDDSVIPSNTKIIYASLRDGNLEIISLDPETKAQTRLTTNDFNDKHPAISADGTKIAFVSDRSGSWAIHTMDSDGTNLSGALVTLTNSTDGNPSWNHDGSRIAYTDNSNIYTMDSDGTNLSGALVTLTNSTDGNPSWNHDGSRIAYNDNLNIYTMDSDGTDPSASLAALTNTSDGYPSWNPDGTKIVYDNNYEIITMNSNGTTKDNLTDTLFKNESDPAWSPDGNYIAYVNDNDDICIISSDGSGSETNLTNDVYTDQDPSW